MASHSSTLAWKIPWTEESGRLQSMGSRRVRHIWATSLSLFTIMHWRRNWQPTTVFLPGESCGQRSLVGVCLWIAQSQTWLKRLSMHACVGEGNGNPFQCSCLESPRDGGAWWAAVYGVAQSRTRLKPLNSSSIESHILLYVKLVSGNLLYDAESSNLVFCDNLEGWEGVGGGREI